MTYMSYDVWDHYNFYFCLEIKKASYKQKTIENYSANLKYKEYSLQLNISVSFSNSHEIRSRREQVTISL